MNGIISTQLWNLLKEVGITIETEGKQKIPLKNLVVPLSDCKDAGATQYYIPNIFIVLGNYGQLHEVTRGYQLYLVFDTVVRRGGRTGKLSWCFTRFAKNGYAFPQDMSCGVELFTDEMQLQARAP